MIEELGFWDYTARYAPIGTASVAILAFGVAVVSILIQKSLTKKRAAIDFFLKTEMDDKMLEAYANSRTGFELLKDGTPVKSFIGTNDYKVVRKYLNVHELMAAGITHGVLDEKTCFSFWADQLVKDCTAARELIVQIRRTPREGTQYTYHGMEELVAKWRCEIERMTVLRR